MDEIYLKQIHEKYIKRCLQLALGGEGHVAPNPMVGAVIVHNDRIIGEGFHTAYGKDHAEIEALKSVHERDLIPHSTLYVNLEPCSHQGRTPPCVSKIIQEGIKDVVISTQDPNPKVSGQGLAMLRENGISVTEGILSEEARFLNRRFFHFHESKKPYVILKWAQTQDGFMDIIRTDEKGVFWISGEESKRKVHLWRSRESAVMVGTRTALIDNPELTVREVSGQNPIRIVLDRNCILPLNIKLFNEQSPTLVINEVQDLKDGNIEWVYLSMDVDFLENLLTCLYDRNIMSVMVEGGAHTLRKFIDLGLWQEARIITSDHFLHEGLSAPKIPRTPTVTEKSGTDLIRYYYNS